MKKIAAAALAVCLSLACAACAAPDRAGTPAAGGRAVLRVTYDSSLYGTAWMDSLSKAYRKEYPDTDLRVTADGALALHYAAVLNAGSDTPDVLFFSNTDWQTDAAAGRLAPLSSVYGSLGTAGFAALREGVAARCTKNGVPYVLPWGARVGGLLYNAALFTQNGWAVPKTTDELSALCAQIDADGVSPFAWSADHAGDWTDIVDAWWAQAEGAEGMQTFLAMQSPEVYAAAGRKTALAAFETLVPGNSYGTPLTMNEAASVKAFLEGHAAMLPAGYLPALAQAALPAHFDLRLMQLPAPTQAKAPTLLAARVAGYAAVPAKAADKTEAAAFLAFFSTPAAQRQFMADTGRPTAFALQNDAQQKWPAWLKSAAAGWQGQWQFLLSDAPVYYTRLFDWPTRGSPVLQIFSGSLTAARAFSDDVYTARRDWTTGS